MNQTRLTLNISSPVPPELGVRGPDRQFHPFLQIGALLAAALGLAAMAGCGNTSSDAGGKSASAASEVEQTQAIVSTPTKTPAAGQGTGSPSTDAQLLDAPPFNLPLVGSSGKLSLSSLKGKVVLVDFWATWCVPCVHEIPDLQALYSQYKDQGLVVVGVTDHSSTADVMSMRKSKGITYPMVVENDKARYDYASGTIPQTFLVGRNGKILKRVTGEPDPSARQFWTPLVENALKS